MMQGEGFFYFKTADCQWVLVGEQILNKAHKSSPAHLDELMMIIDQNWSILVGHYCRNPMADSFMVTLQP